MPHPVLLSKQRRDATMALPHTHGAGWFVCEGVLQGAARRCVSTPRPLSGRPAAGSRRTRPGAVGEAGGG
jgi:hypothetical protein